MHTRLIQLPMIPYLCNNAGLDPRILAALSSQRPNAAQIPLAQAQAQNEAAEQVRRL